MEAFHHTIFSQITENLNAEPYLEIFLQNAQDASSSYIFQNPSSIHNLKLARDIASLIITSSGDFDTQALVAAIETFSKYQCPLAPNKFLETPLREHSLFMLKALKENSRIKEIVKRIFLPMQKNIQTLIRKTLDLPESTELSVAHARRAALVALFTALRQDVSSCFASSLAILIQKEYPELFMKDLEQLLSSGYLTRTIGDKEFVAPINTSSSLGNLFTPVSISSLYPNPSVSIASDFGMQKAFEASKLLSLEEDFSTQIERLLAHQYLMDKLSNPFETITADEILRSTLLHYFNLSYEEVSNHIYAQGIQEKEGLNPLDTSICQFIKAYTASKEAFLNQTQNALLKSWELSLATLADCPTDKSVKHLLLGLGMDETDPSSLLYNLEKKIEEHLIDIHKVIDESEKHYQEARSQLEYVELRLRKPINEQDHQILSFDFHRYKQDLNKALFDWEQNKEKAKKLLSFSPFFLKNLKTYLRKYFRSSYDASLMASKAPIHGDSPAGFRIFFTHGRTNINAWSAIYSFSEYIQFLSEFFVFIEQELQEKRAIQKIETEVSSILRSLTSFIHTEIFLQGALSRINDLDPTQNKNDSSDPLLYTPWTYASSGSLELLIPCYFETSSECIIQTKHPGDAKELVAFYADAMKDLPLSVKNYLEDGHRLLSSSPSHAFSVHPNHPLFMEAWNNDWYSYTWIRDVWIRQHEQFLSDKILFQQEIFTLTEYLAPAMQSGYLLKDLHEVFSDYSLSIPEYYKKAESFFLSILPFNPEHIQKKLCSFLFSSLPLIPEQQIPQLIKKIGAYLGLSSKLNENKYAEASNQATLTTRKFSFLSSTEFLRLLQALTLYGENHSHTSEDIYPRLLSAMRHFQLAYPAPLLFADSNWEQLYFGFTVSLASSQVELWTFDYAGAQGEPLPSWEQYMQPDFEWRFLTNPIDYGMKPPPGYYSGIPERFF